MPLSLSTLLEQIDRGSIPPVILVGGDDDYTVERAFTAIRDRILACDAAVQVESWGEASDLATVLDSFRTGSLFGGRRLLIVPEVNAFVTNKELVRLYEKAVEGWRTAKTDRKRSSSVAKLLHVLGLVGLDADSADGRIAAAIGLGTAEKDLVEMLQSARASGRKATRGEGDAALLAEAIGGGGAAGTTLLLRAGEVPKDSASVALIDRVGAVVIASLRREDVAAVLDEAVQEIAAEYGVSFQPEAVSALRRALGIDRTLGDKYSKEVPDLRPAIAEAERLAIYAGTGAEVTRELVMAQVSVVAGGARYEFGALFTDRKPAEAVEKLRDLIVQARRDDPKTTNEGHYGRFLFALADEIRQLLGIHSFCRVRKLDPRQAISYNQFRDRLAEPLGEYLVRRRLVRQKPHPFPLHKRFEAVRFFHEDELIGALREIAEADYLRKSGGVPVDVALETLVFAAMPR